MLSAFGFSQNVTRSADSTGADPMTPVDATSLERRRQDAFRSSRGRWMSTPREAEQYLKRVAVALRYQGTPRLPLASLRSAVGPADDKTALTTSIELTNHLLGRAVAIEVNVVADRLVLVHRDVMPALYRLVRRGRPLDDLSGLDMTARRALAVVAARREASAGDVRSALGLQASVRADPAYAALAALQRQLLVDRGPFEVPARGLPYLPREGYPYHLFHEAHRDLARAASQLTVDAAAARFVAAYLDGAVFATPRRLASLFKRFLSATQVREALDRLVAAGRTREMRLGREAVVISTRRA
jgi:hypothetical protein